MKLDYLSYRLNKENIAISLTQYKTRLVFKAYKKDLNLIKMIVYESFLIVTSTLSKLHELERPVSLKIDSDDNNIKIMGIKDFLRPNIIICLLCDDSAFPFPGS